MNSRKNSLIIARENELKYSNPAPSRISSSDSVTPYMQTHTNKPEKYNPQSKYSILSYGIDTLILSLYIDWKYSNFLSELERLKQIAYNSREPQLLPEKYNNLFLLKVQGYGKGNYRYQLSSSAFTLNISPTKCSNTMPNMLIEFRAMTLWTLGLETASNKIIEFIEGLECRIIKTHVNRLDLCVDSIMPEKEWSMKLQDKRICRSKKVYDYQSKQKGKDVLESIYIGAGALLVRIYDKILEIKIHPEHAWMFEVWGLNQAPKGTKIIRVEPQIRKPVLKQMGIVTIEDLYKKQDAVWSYVTRNWLKFLQTPEKNKDRQKILPWWLAVQSGYGGYSKPAPRIRHAAVRMDQEKLTRRAQSTIENLMALSISASGEPIESPYTLNDCLKVLEQNILSLGISNSEISSNVLRKISNYKIAL